jgi:hypothetical protein
MEIKMPGLRYRQEWLLVHNHKGSLLRRSHADPTCLKQMHKVEEQNETAVAVTQNNGKIGRVNFIVHRVQKVFIACPPTAPSSETDGRISSAGRHCSYASEHSCHKSHWSLATDWFALCVCLCASHATVISRPYIDGTTVFKTVPCKRQRHHFICCFNAGE